MVYLITGKKGAGKSTYAERFVKELREEGNEVEWIDGDEWRKQHDNQDFTSKGRYRNLMSAAKQAQDYELEDKIVVLSFVAPLKGWRDGMRRYWARSHVIYIPGGTLWEGTTYERPDLNEIRSVSAGFSYRINGEDLKPLL